MALLLSFMAVLLVLSEVTARSVDQDESVVAIVSGTFYALEPLSGKALKRLNRRHLDARNTPRVQAMRLDLGPEVAALDMELSQDSVWSNDSQVVVRRGEQVEEIHNAVDSSCFLSGHLTSQDGAASLNRCGRLSGMIQANHFHYEIEETEGSSLDDSEISNVKVIMRRSDNMTSSDSFVFPNEDLLGSEDKEEDGVIEEDLSKRQGNGIAAEVAVFLDASFTNYMAKNKGRRTVADLTKWLIIKWNVIHKVYGAEKAVGVPFTIKLKKVEVWRENPPYYAKLGSKSRTTTYLETFCQRSSNKPNYDHKMLYTQKTGEFHLGMAFLNGICRSKRKCSLVKAMTSDVKIELHEFGHNIGLEHDPDLEPCRDPQGDGGFMGWGTNYRFLDCYRRDLLKHIKEPGARCLYQNNVNLDTLNPSAEAQKKTKNKKTQNNKTGNKKQNGCN